MGKVTIAASGASPRPATAFVMTPTKSARVSVTVGIPWASSLAADRPHAVRKRKTEVDGQLGMLARKGEALGVAMPLTRRLSELIRDLEDGRRQMDWANLDPLVTLAGGAPA